MKKIQITNILAGKWSFSKNNLIKIGQCTIDIETLHAYEKKAKTSRIRGESI